jgi:hypothetical protein
MIETVNKLNDDLLQLQALLDVTAIALDESTQLPSKKIFWSGLFRIAGKLTQQALNNVENLQDFVLESRERGNHECI